MPPCASCDFWERWHDSKALVGPMEQGDCRRHAPIVATSPTVVAMRSVWPITRATDGCGDYERHLTRRLAE